MGNSPLWIKEIQNTQQQERLVRALLSILNRYRQTGLPTYIFNGAILSISRASDQLGDAIALIAKT